MKFESKGYNAIAYVKDLLNMPNNIICISKGYNATAFEL